MGCLSNATPMINTLDKVRAGVDGFVILCNIISNTFIICAISRQWRRQKFSISNKMSCLLITNLSAADGLVAVFSIYYYLPKYLCSFAEYLRHNFLPCILRFMLLDTAHLGSGFTLAAIAVDRYIAVAHPMKYRAVLSTKRTVVIIGMIWMFTILFIIHLFYLNRWKDGLQCTGEVVIPKLYFYVISALQFVLLGIVATVYYRIHREACKLHERDKEMRLSNKRFRSPATALLIIIGIYLISWLPRMSLIIIHNTITKVPDLALEIASSFVNLNYLVNPLIYAYNTRSVKVALSDAMKCLRKRIPFINTRSAVTEPVLQCNVLNLTQKDTQLLESITTQRDRFESQVESVSNLTDTKIICDINNRNVCVIGEHTSETSTD